MSMRPTNMAELKTAPADLGDLGDDQVLVTVVDHVYKAGPIFF